MSENSGWLPPTSGGDRDARPQEETPAPRYGAYGSAPAGTPSYVSYGSEDPGQQGAAHPGAPYPGAPYPGSTHPGDSYPGGLPPQGGWGGPDASAPYAQGSGAPGGFFLAPKPGIIPLRPLGITEIIGGAVDALRANPRAMFLPALVVMTVIGLVSALLSGLSMRSLNSIAQTLESDASPTADQLAPMVGGSLATMGSTALEGLITSIATAVLTGLLIVAVSRSVLGRVATPGEAWERTRGRVWALIGQSLLINLITGVVALVLVGAAVLLAVVIVSSASDGSTTAVVLAVLAAIILGLGAVVASLFLAVRLSMSSSALILENVGVLDGIRRSWRLTRGSFWRVLGILVLAGLIQALVTGLLGGLASMVSTLITATAPTQIALATAVTSFIATVLSALILPFTASVTALTYIDLRMRHEGLDVELRQAATR
ncbi:glycerophosphoryl diester phosphodiesterase membrane domain-containing protein [Actinomyces radicidentis]|uniref:glycerophosphoryl diester phosphodiesterase membrane domain-containing protein n=1 Tax=Actinomyces radicidentis TaxID=111015 RepID=UPI0026DF05CF|nr:glycerophosphoryl diester phosphodiesterase membrane domain-containing protein [Actinomyces radicidentis]